MHIHWRPSLLLTCLLLAGGVECGRAQFRGMTSLPWCPPRPTADAAADADILSRIGEAMDQGQWQLVVEQLYPQAIQQGYQRNESLYDQTRQALRQLLMQDDGERWWQQMQRLYQDRYALLGRDGYQYQNRLDTRAWCDEQLRNEQVLCLAGRPSQFEVCFDLVRSLVQKNQGHVDLVLVTQGMFAPLNREHVRHQSEWTPAQYQQRYADVLACLESAEAYMATQHPREYADRYRPQNLAMLRDECQRRQSDGTSAASAFATSEYHAEAGNPQAAGSLYEEAHREYEHRQYAQAYQHVSQLLQQHADLREAHQLKCSILQGAANASSEMADKVAYWCAAYEAGQGYADRKTLSQLVSALRSHLFMTGLAGKYHTTSRPIYLRQRIWTMEQLKKM